MHERAGNPGERRHRAGYRARVPSTEHLLAFLLAGVVLVAIPGPSVLFIVGRALAHGRRAALTSVAGNTTGVVLIVLAVALGIGAVAAASAAVFSVLKLAGAAYLAYLGVQTWRHRGDLAVALGAAGAPPGRRVFWQGVVVGATNPKVLVLFVALLPQFTDPATPGARPRRCSCSGCCSPCSPRRWTACGGWRRAPRATGSRPRPPACAGSAVRAA